MRFRFALAVILAVGGLVPSASNAQQAVLDRLAQDDTLVIAHRSAVIDGLPENSIAWIEAAFSHGVDMVHINPNQTADGQYVLMHDPTLNRMTDVLTVYPTGAPGGPDRAARGGRDYVRDYTLDEIGELTLVGSDQAPPSLTDALDAVGDGLALIGLKNYEVETLAATLAERDLSHVIFFDLYYSGTDQSKLRALADATGIGVSVTLYETRDAMRDLNAIADQLGPSLKLVMMAPQVATPEVIARARELGLFVALSGRDRAEDSALARNGDATPWLDVIGSADAVSTDYPVQLLDALR